MIIYLDLIFFINFAYDFLLLLTVAMTLKRKVKFIRIIIASLIGAISIFLLFLNINETLVFVLKILVSIIMCLISYKYISIKYTLYNIGYLYMLSIILAGFLYLLNNELSYYHVGIVFVNKNISINYIVLLIISPIILFLFYKSNKKLKNTYSDYYKIKIVFDNIEINCISFYDNGNNLIDPITKKAVIIINSNLLKKIYNIRDPVYVPFKTIDGTSLLKCYKPSYIIINNHKVYNYLIGEAKIKLKDGIDCILNKKLMEDNYV